MLPGFDLVVLLQPTSPLRRPVDIDCCVEKCAALGVNACVSVTPSRENPAWLYRIDARGHLRPAFAEAAATRDAEAPSQLLNGAVYAARIAWLREQRSFLTHETVGYVMPGEFSLDIDTPQDLAIADLILSREPMRGDTPTPKSGTAA